MLDDWCDGVSYLQKLDGKCSTCVQNSSPHFTQKAHFCFLSFHFLVPVFQNHAHSGELKNILSRRGAVCGEAWSTGISTSGNMLYYIFSQFVVSIQGTFSGYCLVGNSTDIRYWAEINQTLGVFGGTDYDDDKSCCIIKPRDVTLTQWDNSHYFRTKDSLLKVKSIEFDVESLLCVVNTLSGQCVVLSTCIVILCVVYC